MRKSRVIAFVVASLVSSASLVQAQSAAPGQQVPRREARGGVRGERGHGGALRGIKLSDTEKAKLKTVRQKYAAEGKSLRESLKPAMQEVRAARQKGDTAAAKAVWARNQGGRDQLKALRDRQQAEIRASLSPENQKLFDANVAKQAERRAEFAKRGGKGQHKAGHKGHKGARRAGTNG
jgi:Spy/CpxP family protein refolding chaperone